MAFAVLTMRNRQSGLVKMAPVGFSWTSLFFSGFVGIFRGDTVKGVLWIVLSCIFPLLTQIIQACIYNKTYITDLIERGYRVTDASMPLEYINARLEMDLPTV